MQLETEPSHVGLILPTLLVLQETGATGGFNGDDGSSGDGIDDDNGEHDGDGYGVVGWQPATVAPWTTSTAPDLVWVTTTTVRTTAKPTAGSPAPTVPRPIDGTASTDSKVAWPPAELVAATAAGVAGGALFFVLCWCCWRLKARQVRDKALETIILPKLRT